MNNMANIGFARVSTNTQDLTSQLERLEEAGCIKVFQGKHSGKQETNKQALAELLDYVRAGDTVVVTKLDRLGRSLSQVLTVLDEFKLKGVNLIAIDQQIDTSNDSPMNRAMVQLLGMFAELERNFIVSRTQEGKASSGNYGGRPNKLDDRVKQTIRAKHSKGTSISVLARDHMVSRATIGRIIGTVK